MNSGSSTEARQPLPPWTLVTSHGLVLLYVVAHPDATIHEMAERLEYTERRIAAIVRDLQREGLVEVTKVGRRNSYKLCDDARFRHPFVSKIPFEAFVRLWQQNEASAN